MCWGKRCDPHGIHRKVKVYRVIGFVQFFELLESHHSPPPRLRTRKDFRCFSPQGSARGGFGGFLPTKESLLTFKVFGAAMHIERESWDVAPTTAGVQHSSFARVVEKKNLPLGLYIPTDH